MGRGQACQARSILFQQSQEQVNWDNFEELGVLCDQLGTALQRLLQYIRIGAVGLQQALYVRVEVSSQFRGGQEPQCGQCQRYHVLVWVFQVIIDQVCEQSEQVLRLVEQQCSRQVSEPLIDVLVRGDQVYALDLPEVRALAQDVQVQQLDDVVTLLVRGEVVISELCPYLSCLFVDYGTLVG